MSVMGIYRGMNANRSVFSSSDDRVEDGKAWLLVSISDPSFQHEFYRVCHFSTLSSSWQSSSQTFDTQLEIKYSSKVRSWYLHVLEPLGHEHSCTDPGQLHVQGLFRLNPGGPVGDVGVADSVSNLHPPTGSFFAERTSAVRRTGVGSGSGSSRSYKHVKTRLFVQIHEFQSVGLRMNGCVDAPEANGVYHRLRGISFSNNAFGSSPANHQTVMVFDSSGAENSRCLLLMCVGTPWHTRQTGGGIDDADAVDLTKGDPVVVTLSVLRFPARTGIDAGSDDDVEAVTATSGGGQSLSPLEKMEELDLYLRYQSSAVRHNLSFSQWPLTPRIVHMSAVFSSFEDVCLPFSSDTAPFIAREVSPNDKYLKCEWCNTFTEPGVEWVAGMRIDSPLTVASVDWTSARETVIPRLEQLAAYRCHELGLLEVEYCKNGRRIPCSVPVAVGRRVFRDTMAALGTTVMDAEGGADEVAVDKRVLQKHGIDENLLNGTIDDDDGHDDDHATDDGVDAFIVDDSGSGEECCMPVPDSQDDEVEDELALVEHIQRKVRESKRGLKLDGEEKEKKKEKKKEKGICQRVPDGADDLVDTDEEERVEVANHNGHDYDGEDEHDGGGLVDTDEEDGRRPPLHVTKRLRKR